MRKKKRRKSGGQKEDVELLYIGRDKPTAVVHSTANLGREGTASASIIRNESEGITYTGRATPLTGGQPEVARSSVITRSSFT